jgi:hypothetical protein
MCKRQSFHHVGLMPPTRRSPFSLRGQRLVRAEIVG